MNLTDEIYTRAIALLGEPDPQQQTMLHTLCTVANGTIAAELHQDFELISCQEVLSIAGSLYAVADYLEMDDTHNVERFTVGDMTITRTNATEAAKRLRQKADRMLQPYRGDRFSFRRV